MPSPFPGMDPYIESTYWKNFHSQLASEIVRQLSPQVLPKYFAMTTETFVLDEPEMVSITSARLLPDVSVAEAEAGPTREGVAVATAPVEIATVMPERAVQISIEIRDAQQRELITAIEILSPSNKRGDGREDYLKKRRRLLLSPCHLLEVDLLRAGVRPPMKSELPSEPYFVFLSRDERKPITQVWPISLRSALPTIPIPLREPDPDVSVDLQTAMNAVYDISGYAVAINYDEPPRPPLGYEDTTWAQTLIQQHTAKGNGR